MSEEGIVQVPHESNSIITNLKDERKRVSLVTFAVLCGSASYILMLFVALPISVHLIINTQNGCDVKTDTACFNIILKVVALV